MIKEETLFYWQRLPLMLSWTSAFLLKISSLALVVILLIKAGGDVDNHFDSWWYHLPWAARLAGLISPEAYLFEPIAAARFEGFPVLPELLQGYFWRVTGRVEAANLVSFVSFIGFIWLLRHYFKVPWWLSIPALLAVPLVQGQVTSTYVDLFANLAMAAFTLMTFLAYVRRDLISIKFFFVMAVAAFVAANSKLQLIPLVALTLVFALYPLVTWLLTTKQGKINNFKLMLIGVTVFAAIAVIFYVPLKNVVEHGNPVYPLKVEILGTELKHAEPLPPPGVGGGELAQASRLTKWFYSVFEIGMGPLFNVKRWVIDSASPAGSPLGIQGGLFGAYVAFQLILFCFLLTGIARRYLKPALVLILLSMMVVSIMPASHLLRYYMFWFISVISLNLYFLSFTNFKHIRNYVGIVFLAFLAIVVDASDQNFIHPHFHSVEQLRAERINPAILDEIRQTGSVCLALKNANEPFLYASFWESDSDYSIQAGPFRPDYQPELDSTCHDRKVIRVRS